MEGLFLGAGSEFQLLSTSLPGLIADNTAREGAGVYAIGAGAFFESVNSHILRNTASERGGGAVAAGNALFSMYRTSNCSSEQCSLLSDNQITSGTSADGGAALAVQAGFALIYQTILEGNHAPDSQGAILLKENSEIYLEGDIFFDNDSGSGGIMVAYPDSFIQMGHSTVGSNSGRPFLSNSGVDVTAEVYSSAFFGHPWGGGSTGTMLFDCSIAPSFLSINGFWDHSGVARSRPTLRRSSRRGLSLGARFSSDRPL